MTEYNELSVHDRALILEGLVTIVANTELLRNHLRHLEPEGATPVLNRGAVMGQDSAGNIYHQLGGPSARWVSFHISSRSKWTSLVVVASITMSLPAQMMRSWLSSFITAGITCHWQSCVTEACYQATSLVLLQW